MQFFWNSGKPREIEKGGVVFVVKPPTVGEQLEISSSVGEAAGGGSGTDGIKKLPDAVKRIVAAHIKDIKGLKDENGNSVDFNSLELDEFAQNLTVPLLYMIIEVVLESVKLPEDAKKKFSPQAASGEGQSSQMNEEWHSSDYE